jgi:hypothetical protein
MGFIRNTFYTQIDTTLPHSHKKTHPKITKLIIFFIFFIFFLGFSYEYFLYYKPKYRFLKNVLTGDFFSL